MKNLQHFLLVLLALLLASCGPKRYPSSLSDKDLENVKISESANTVSQSLVELARIQSALTPPVGGYRLPDPDSYGMKELASLDWSGPIGPAVEQITESSHYRLRVLGHPPSVPIIVTVIAKNVPLGTLLRDIAFQAGHKASVIVYPSRRVIELRYASA